MILFGNTKVFVHNEDTVPFYGTCLENQPVNLCHVSNFYRVVWESYKGSEGNKIGYDYPAIKFEGINTHWRFETEERRDAIYIQLIWDHCEGVN